jgi:hypothetical protein
MHINTNKINVKPPQKPQKIVKKGKKAKILANLSKI